MTYPTLYDLASRLLRADEGKKKATKASVPVTDGIIPKAVNLEPGWNGWLGPAELAPIRVAVSPSGIAGMQRDPTADAAGRKKVREIAEVILQGRPLPPALIAIDPLDKSLWLPDGGHRGCASFVARLPIWVVTRALTEDERRFIFIGQVEARPINKQHFVCNGQDPLDLYVQDALTSTGHAWSKMVRLKAHGGVMSPGQMADLAGDYGCNQPGTTYKHLDQSRFDAKAADELASLLRAFGPYDANPEAYRDKMRRATTTAAIYAVRRSDHKAEDVARWNRHMPKFRFHDVAHIREASQLVDNLLAHWNKRLSSDRKVSR